MPRQLDTDERADRVTRATWRLLARSGLESLSVRHVAQEADLPQSSMRYLFPTRASIQVAAMRALLDETERRVSAHHPGDEPAAQPADPVDDAVAVLRELLPLDAQRRLEISALVALAGASAADDGDPALRDVQEEAHGRLARICRTALAPLLGHEPEQLEREARRTHALVDGLALHVLQREGSSEPDWAADVLRGHVAGLTTAA
ncbi:TetR family transcriptional regulator C-terminal domain-containing protein [Nesterenkonia halophila]